MNIVVALTSFKGTLNALAACQAAALGFKKAYPKAEITILPVSDGGDGLIEAVASRHKTTKVGVNVSGPLGEPAQCEYLLFKKDKEKVALIESAMAIGLGLVAPARRNPALTTTYGLGKVIQHALGRRVKAIYVGLGGSSTQDGGCGLAQALGVKLLDADKKQIGFGCGWIGALDSIDVTRRDKRLKKVKIYALSDVTNPLLGEQGTARVYAPQKGATPEQVEAIEKNLKRLAEIVKRDLQLDVSNFPGSGAAGGLGAGLVGFLGANILPGATTVLELINAKEVISKADLVIVGEGKLDNQTLQGKAPQAVSILAQSLGKKVYGIFGQIAGEPADMARQLGLSDCVSLTALVGQEKAASQTPRVLSQAAAKLLERSESTRFASIL